MSYYPEPGSYTRDKVKVDFSNYKTKRKEHTRGVDTSDLAAKNFFIGLRAEIDKLDINKITNFPTSLSNVKTKIDDLHVVKLKIVPVDFMSG